MNRTPQIIGMFLLLASGMLSARDSDWFETRMKKLDSLSTLAREDQIETLGSMVGPIGTNRVMDKEQLQIFQRAQTLLLSIPNHAKYFADQVATARAASKNIITDRNYHAVCQTLRDTLPHLPDPETVQVLGQMLESGEDVPTQQQWIEFLMMKHRGGDLEWYYPSRMGGEALLSLGMRNMPLGPDKYGQIPSYDEEWLRGWWEEIKSGKRTFSFKGQSVEYRFKPDGTWETIAMANPPDDGPHPSPAEAPRPVKRPLPPAPPPPASVPPSAPSQTGYWWIIAAGISAFVAAAFLLKRRHAS